MSAKKKRAAPLAARPSSRMWIYWGIVFLCVVAYFVQTIVTLGTTGPTSDQVAHLPAGYAELQTGHVVFNPEHPPLAKLIGAAAMGAEAGSIDEAVPNWRDLNEWTFGRAFLFAPGRNPTALLSSARRGPIVVGLLLCLACFVWSFRLYGAAGGLFTLALSVFCPTILAHARLVTTDVPVAAFGVLSAYLIWETLNTPSVWRAVAAGAALGACCASKFSGIILTPAMMIAAVIAMRRRSLTEMRRMAVLSAVAIVVGVVVIAATYGIPLSLWGYIAGFGNVRDHSNPAFLSFLFGTYRQGSFPLYFPAAFLIKTSPALLIALVMLAATVPLRRAGLAQGAPSTGVDPRTMIWGCVIVYAGFIMLTAWDIGIRYLIPIYPFLFVAVGAVGAELWRTRPGKGVASAVVALQIMAAVKAWPDPISYFNGLFGCEGPAAVHCLSDSNFDWGQDLVRALAVVDSMRRPEEQVVLDYFGSTDARAYSTNMRLFDPAELSAPASQLYVMSATELDFQMYKAALPNQENWFNRYHPTRYVGNTFLIYDFRAGAPR